MNQRERAMRAKAIADGIPVYKPAPKTRSGNLGVEASHRVVHIKKTAPGVKSRTPANYVDHVVSTAKPKEPEKVKLPPITTMELSRRLVQHCAMDPSINRSIQDVEIASEWVNTLLPRHAES